MSEVRQLKLSSGEEVICQVLDWADEENGDIIVRHVYKVTTIDDDARGLRLYNLRPWMTMQEGDDMFINLNIMHVIAQAKPDSKLETQFKGAVKHSNMTEEELEQKVQDYIDQMRNSLNEDEDFDNVISFPGNDKIH